MIAVILSKNDACKACFVYTIIYCKFASLHEKQVDISLDVNEKQAQHYGCENNIARYLRLQNTVLFHQESFCMHTKCVIFNFAFQSNYYLLLKFSSNRKNSTYAYYFEKQKNQCFKYILN